MKNITKLWTGIVLLQCIVVALAADPKFDPTTRMRLVLVPADAQVGSVIYRLRASDEEFDYPLTFELVGMENLCIFLYCLYFKWTHLLLPCASR